MAGREYRRGAIYLIVVLAAACSAPKADARPPAAAVLEAGSPAAAATSNAGRTPAAFTEAATIKEIVRLVEAKRSEDESFGRAAEGLRLNLGGQVRTGNVSRARLDFVSGAMVRLGPNSLFAIQSVEGQSESLLTRLRLEIGKLWVSVSGGAVEVETPVGAASVRGSFAVFEYDPGDAANPADDVLIVSCIEGQCGVRREGLSESFGNLQQLTLKREAPPALAPLGGEAVADFIANNPEVAQAVPATLTAAPTLAATGDPTALASATAAYTPTPTAAEQTANPTIKATSALPSTAAPIERGTIFPAPGTVLSLPTATVAPPAATSLPLTVTLPPAAALSTATLPPATVSLSPTFPLPTVTLSPLPR